MTRQRLSIPANAVEAIVEDVRRYGLHHVETGALLLTKPGEHVILAAALAGEAGIERSEGLFIITLPAFDALFTYAEDHGLQVRAMVHSHPREAFLSPTDRRYGLRMRGFLSAVVPTYADPPVTPQAWGWWRYDDDWHPTEPAEATGADTSAQVLTFDAGGVREHRLQP